MNTTQIRREVQTYGLWMPTHNALRLSYLDWVLERTQASIGVEDHTLLLQRKSNSLQRKSNTVRETTQIINNERNK